jgi:hypothetical protein
MTVALKSGEKWDYVETLSGNKRRYRMDGEAPPPRLFGTLAEEMDKQAALQSRAQARLDAPKPAQKINGDSQHTPAPTEQGRPAMAQEASQEVMTRRDLRTAFKRIAWHLPAEFRKPYIADEIKVRLGGNFTQSSLDNFVQECLDNGTIIRVRFGWFTLKEGYAVPPPPEPVKAPPVEAQPLKTSVPVLPTLTNPLPSKNPLDAVFVKPFAPKQEVQEAAPPALNGKGAATTTPPMQSVAQQPDLQNSVLSMMVLGDLLAARTEGDDMLMLEIHEWMATGGKLLERLGSAIYKYEKAEQARNQLLTLLGREPKMIGAVSKAPTPDLNSIPSDKAAMPN